VEITVSEFSQGVPASSKLVVGGDGMMEHFGVVGGHQHCWW